MTHSHTSYVRFVAAVLGFLLVIAPAAMAQSTMVKGKVTDVDGQPLAEITITVEFIGGINRKVETKTDRRGEFIQLLTQSGRYRVTASGENFGSASTELAVRTGRASEANIVLAPATAANNEGVAAELKQAFADGVAMSKSGDHDGSIERFQAALAISPECVDCHYNIGVAHLAKKDEKQAEAAWLKGLEVKPDYAEGLNALSTLYNNQKRFDEAAAMSERAASAGGGSAGSADAVFNQGVILWNQGKIAEAKVKFEEAIAANPTFAEAHFQLGMAFLNEGKLVEAVGSFETYVKLAPDGPFAGQAKGMMAQLKQ